MRILTTCLLLALCSPLLAATTVVELTVVPSARASLTAGQDWARLLSQLKSVRVRTTNSASPQPQVTRDAGRIRVTAVIGASDQLYVPDQRFTLRQRSALQAWIDELRNDKPKEKVDRFGLTPAQLKTTNEALKRVVRFSTSQQSALDSVGRITRLVGYPLRLASADRLALERSQLTHELEGISCGTALAIICRSVERVVVPRARDDGKIELVLSPEGQEGWPVGWDPPLKKQELIPKLFNMLEIEVTETPVTQVTDAVATRTEARFFYDEALFRAAKQNPSQTKVTVPSGRMTYSALLRKSIFNAKMKAELLVDERGTPFFWVTPSIRRGRR